MFAIPGHHLVEHVDGRRQMKPPQPAAEPSGELDLGQEHDAPALVAGDECAIAEHDPPAFAALFLGHRGEQASRLLGCEREQGQLLATVERGDDPRRPAAKSSAAGIEQHRAPKLRVLGHWRVIVHRSPEVYSAWPRPPPLRAG